MTRKVMTETELKLLIAEHGQARLAAELGLSTTQFNRIYIGESGIKLGLVGPLLYHLERKIVPLDTEIMNIERSKIEFVMTAMKMVFGDE